MKNHNPFIGITIILGIAIFALGIFRVAKIDHTEPIIENATTTPEVVEIATTTEPKTLVKPNIQEKPVTSKPEYTSPAPVYIPPVINVTQNNYTAPTTNNEVPVTSSSDFVEPKPMTTLEIAQDIVKLYDPNGTAEIYNETKIRAYVFNGKSVTVDLVQGWEENLKLTLRKIK